MCSGFRTIDSNAFDSCIDFNGFFILFYSLVGDKAKKVLSTNPSQPSMEFQATLSGSGSWLLLSIVMTLLPLPHEKSDPNSEPLLKSYALLPLLLCEENTLMKANDITLNQLHMLPLPLL